MPMCGKYLPSSMPVHEQYTPLSPAAIVAVVAFCSVAVSVLGSDFSVPSRRACADYDPISHKNL